MTNNKVVEQRLTEYATAATRKIEPSAKTYSADPSRQRSDCGASSVKLGGGGARTSFGLYIAVIIARLAGALFATIGTLGCTSDRSLSLPRLRAVLSP
jgi:hypothetical protein